MLIEKKDSYALSFISLVPCAASSVCWREVTRVAPSPAPDHGVQTHTTTCDVGSAVSADAARHAEEVSSVTGLLRVFLKSLKQSLGFVKCFLCGVFENENMSFVVTVVNMVNYSDFSSSSTALHS